MELILNASILNSVTIFFIKLDVEKSRYRGKRNKENLKTKRKKYGQYIIERKLNHAHYKINK